jgi:hypothetical protein
MRTWIKAPGNGRTRVVYIDVVYIWTDGSVIDGRMDRCACAYHKVTSAVCTKMQYHAVDRAHLQGHGLTFSRHIGR